MKKGFNISNRVKVLKRIQIKFIIVFLFLSFSIIYSQIERETRAVWVSTNFHLDWPPPTYDEQKQKAALNEIFENIKSKNLNTVYFQVRSSGTVMFKSSFDPLSPYITGKVGGNASYDPLEYAIEQAHKRGLEIHAWVNVVRCFSGTETYILKSPDHISQRKPEWIVEDKSNGNTSYWLDPGLPEVREYLSDLISEIAEKYDIDGIQMDFIRYPGKNFDDTFSYSVYGKGKSKDQWRRDNITDIVRLVYEKVKSIKPYVKIGAAPVGIYKNEEGSYNLEGYGDVYQDSRSWLANGIVDYLVPQVYWGINDQPDFTKIAKDWTEHNFNRSIIIGVGAYKDNVKEQLNKIVGYTRTLGCDGISFFRYSNIKDYNFRLFTYRTFPASMAWLDGFAPSPPYNLIYSRHGSNPSLITLSWETEKAKSRNDSVSYYALYNLPSMTSKTDPEHLLDIVEDARNSITLGIKEPKRINYYFTLKTLNRLWNESLKSSNVVNVKFNELSLFATLDDMFENPVLLKGSNDSSKILLFAKQKEGIKISSGDSKIEISKTIYPGKNVLMIPNSLLNKKKIQITFENSKRVVELNL